MLNYDLNKINLQVKPNLEIVVSNLELGFLYDMYILI
jgi:hypothetical protein